MAGKLSGEAVKKNLIWVGCVLIVIIGAVCWYMATGQLQEIYARNTGAINTQHSTIDRRISNPQNRSPKSIQGITRDIEDERENVRKAWEVIYRQQVEQVFVWPQTSDPTFQAKMKALGPNDEIPERMLAAYQNAVVNEFRQLARMIDADTGGEAGARASRDVIVRWADLDRISPRFVSRQTPTSLWVRVRQEDLWVYGAFCKAIASVNKGAQGRTLASVRVIEAMEIADAVQRPSASEKRVERGKSAPGATAPAADLTPAIPRAGGEAGGADEVLKEKRYIDLKGRPLTVAEDKSAGPIEFKLIPFRLSLVLDQRDVDRLLVELRNSPLPIEVREVRIAAASGAAAMSRAQQGSGDDEPKLQVPVELSGVAIIYKPPDYAKLGYDKPPQDSIQVAPAGPFTVVTAAAGKLSVKSADGQPQDVDLPPGVKITVNGNQATIDDVKADMAVEFERDSDNQVTAVKATGSAATPAPAPAATSPTTPAAPATTAEEPQPTEPEANAGGAETPQ